MMRRFEPDGEPISPPPKRPAGATAEGAGAGEDQRTGVEALGAWCAEHAQEQRLSE